jgi:hypothetical protein
MIPKTLRKFIYQLQGATDDRAVQWQEGASDAFFCTHKGLDLHISYFFDMDEGVGYYSFRIIGKGKNAGFTVTSHEESDYADMNNLFSSITVNASKLDEDLKNFFD